MTKGDIERYRVEAAIAAMAAIIPINIEVGPNPEECASDARIYADALMAELGLGGE